jgi:hypothetical protein
MAASMRGYKSQQYFLKNIYNKNNIINVLFNSSKAGKNYFYTLLQLLININSNALCFTFVISAEITQMQNLYNYNNCCKNSLKNV